MIATIDIPDKLHRKLEAEKRRTGLSKSQQIRHILIQHFAEKERITKKTAA